MSELPLTGLIAAFGNYLVKNGPVPKEMGRVLNRAHEIRLAADYSSASVDLTDAREMVDQAESFVDAIRVEFMPDESDDNDCRMGP